MDNLERQLSREGSPRIRGVIFDHNGVFVPDVWEHCFFDEGNSLMKHFSLPKDKLKATGELLVREFYQTPTDEKTSWQDIERRYWNRFLEEFSGQIPSSVAVDELIEFSKFFIKGIHPKSMRTLLQELKDERIKLAICSNNTEFWFARQMEAVDLSPYIPPENFILSSRVGVRKSDKSGKLFHESLRVLGEPASQVVYVDDRASNFKNAEYVGITNTIVFETDNPQAPTLLRNEFVQRGILGEQTGI